MTETEQLAAAKSFLGKLANGEMSWFEFEIYPDGRGTVQTDANVDLSEAEVELLTLISDREPRKGSGPGGMPEDWSYGD